MQVAVEPTTGLERRMTVELPEEGVVEEVGTRLKHLMQTARVPGFRPGKAPLKVIAQRFGTAVREEVVGDLVRGSFGEALTNERLRPAGEPRFDSLASEPGQGVRYTAVFEVFPEITLSELESIEVRRPAASVEEANVDRMIETLRRQRRTWHEVERAAREGDRVTIDFQGTVDGEPFDGGSAEGRVVELGAGHLIADFEAGLVGIEASGRRDIEVRFPSEYPAAHLAGKTAVFDATASKVEEAALPEVDADLVRSFGIESGEIEEFRANVRSNLERELASAISAATRNNLLDALLAHHPVEVPNVLVAEELSRQRSRDARTLAMQGIDPADLGEAVGGGEALARRRVQLGLLLSEIVSEGELQPSPDEVRAAVERMAETYESPEQVVSWFYADPARLQPLESQLMEERAVESVLERVHLVDEPTEFDALLNPGQTTQARS